MQTDNWEKVKDLLNETLRIENSKRREFIHNSGYLAEIRAEVESLIAFEDEAKNLMKLSAIEFSKDFFDENETSDLLIGQQIGAYKIVREIGFGGMGTVYLAERIDGKFEQKVALKLLKREFNIKRLRHSFQRESEIQAKLNHPNIARLLDTGTTRDGIPFLALEYIEGLPIDKFCEKNNLPLNSRLKIFIKACQAVSFAHQNLVIHRDLKPSNILVTETGELKLLDFGISKILNGEQTLENNTFTMLEAMTPEYASPEQIKGEMVTTSTDIYSLGVVLYKILTDSLPHNFYGKSNGDLFKAITEGEPTKPSDVLSSDNRANPKSKIQNLKSLKGDIDNIILKALRKEPEQRYKTVEQFSDDIWRFIDGLPVLARPATLSYRANKFFQRNKISAIAGLLVFVSLVAGIAVATRQTSVAREQARVAAEAHNAAVAEAVKAKTEQAKAEKITKFMSKIIGYANPAWYAEGANSHGEARVIDVVEDLSDKIDKEFANEADVAAELHYKFSEVFHWVGRNANNERSEKLRQQRDFHALRALELRKQFYGEHHELVAKDLFGVYAIIGKNHEEQAKLLAEAIQMMRETNPQNLNLPYMFEAYTARLIMPNQKETHEAYRNAVSPPTDENSYQIAERMLRESLPVFRLHYKEDNSAIFSAECKLSYILAMQEKWTDFNEHYAVCKQYDGKLTHPDVKVYMKMYIELIEKIVVEKNKTR